jgi:SAM-dependent methyltransferase
MKLKISETVPYDAAFYSRHKNLSVSSAAAVLPIVQKLTDFQSAVDLGCGTGAWVATCAELGVTDLLGIDGSYVDPSTLVIDTNWFMAHDLTAPLKVGRRYDLAISMEVGEHLPESAADVFVENLCSLSDAVLFSAAAPGQGGTNHINEQWPEYWAAKFGKHGFRMIDCLRQEIWENESVAAWYRQNAFICLRFPQNYPHIVPYLDRPLLRLVHPHLHKPNPSIRESLDLLKRAVLRRARRTMSGQ